MGITIAITGNAMIQNKTSEFCCTDHIGSKFIPCWRGCKFESDSVETM